MKRIIFFLSFVAAYCVSISAHAQGKTILVADASSTGMYADMVKQLKEFCDSDDLQITEVPVKGGAADNLEALANNTASVALLHSDVIFALSQSDPKYQRLATLFTLYREEIHIITLRNSGVKQGAKFGFGGKEVTFNDLSSLRGYKVGAAGGGVYTARLLTGQGEGHFDVVPYITGGELLPALDSGQVQAIIFVGGAPLANIQKLDGNKYKLLSIPESMSVKLQTVYKSATITYPNMKSGPVRTLAPYAIALTRKYTRPNMVNPQRNFRQCFFDHLDDLKETPGKHAKWQEIDPNDKGTWAWYDLPSTDTVSVPGVVTKKKK